MLLDPPRPCGICRRDDAICLQLVLWFLLDRGFIYEYSTYKHCRHSNALVKLSAHPRLSDGRLAKQPLRVDPTLR